MVRGHMQNRSGLEPNEATGKQHGQFTDSVRKVRCLRAVPGARRIRYPRTAPS